MVSSLRGAAVVVHLGSLSESGLAQENSVVVSGGRYVGG